MVKFLLYLLLICSCYASSRARVGTIRNKLPSIHQLQLQGRRHLLTRNGSKPACYCFSAVLQLTQGAITSESVRVRRQCGLRLARCDLDLGKLEQAIARCSEVISECPDIKPSFDDSKSYTLRDENDVQDLGEQEKVLHDLGTAYYLRAKCLQQMGKPAMASRDFQCALNCLPDEIRIHTELSELDSAATVTESEDSSSTDDDMIDFLEDCTLKHPSLVFSKSQLRRLLSPSLPLHVSPTLASSGSRPNAASVSASSPLDLSALFGSLGEAPSLSSSGLSKGDLGVNIGDNSKNGLLGKVTSFVPLLCSLAGVPADTARNIVKFLSALSTVYTTTQRAYAAVRTHSDTLMMLLSALWAVGLLRSYWNL